jgi:regulator of ribonuclease activity A
MARDANIIRTADICDDYADELLVCELAFNDYAARSHFHGEVMTFATYEDNKGIREILAQGGAGKVLVVDGRGSRRRALCGGHIAAEAC